MGRGILRGALLLTIALVGTLPLARPAGAAAPVQGWVARAEAAAVPGSADPLAVASARALKVLMAQDVRGYAQARQQVAQLVAARAKSATAAQLVAAWSAANLRRLLALYAGLAQVGVPYRFAGSLAGKAFDCSGLTAYAWGVAGRTLPRNSTMQAVRLRSVPQAQAGVGDIIWYPGHVSLYLGAGKAMVHAPQPGKTVEVRDAKRWVKTVTAAD
jgi:cell wall-associated NlpC family hydrolase